MRPHFGLRRDPQLPGSLDCSSCDPDNEIEMDHYPGISTRHRPLSERMNGLLDRGFRIARRMAIAFGLSTVVAIGVGAAVTDNAIVQIFVTVLAAIGLWLPMMFLIVSVEGFFGRLRRPASAATIDLAASPAPAEHWQRLIALAPDQRDRLAAIRRSLESSRLTLASAELNPDAHDLCLLIDRRLPQLIEHQLDSLPPDDRGRRKELGDLVDLVEQFARHCSRQRDGATSDSSYQAEILRRRFEERLGDNRLGSQ